MTGLLGEVGKRLLDKWFTFLVLPGLLFVGTAVAGFHLGQAHAFDAPALARWVTDRLGTRRPNDTGAVLPAIAAAGLAAAGAGLGAAALGRLIAALWTLPAGRGPLGRLARRRRDRWSDADAAVTAAVSAAVTGAPPGGVGAALAARDRISRAEPTRPSWTGDRLTAPADRVRSAYGLDLGAVWPRLWLLLPDAARADLLAAHTAYASATRLSGWAVLYALLVPFWWPAALVAAGTGAAAHVQTRAAAAALADLTEAAVDLYAPELAARLGLPDDTPLSRETGFAVTAALRKDVLRPPETGSLLRRRDPGALS
ncbi:hypothetical protein [Actinomadura chibensis]|uniref:Vegetative cell wall protein gp1 n=1 Tax=Actinomadura chibensis TaxID=392828 RepID=A0A5D0NM89_9ACTN|nr:hypothetical protein [Actinomadura chibensis]TYB45525.1 hypothetical protein FXF69_19025 [Actinomadura chibensis]